MKNVTLQILEDTARDAVRRQVRFDPALRELDQRQKLLHQEFICQHKSNPALRRQVLCLLDAQGAVDDLEKDLLFRLGLQMGLDLRGLDTLRPEE